MFFRGANSIEGRGIWFFQKNFMSPIRTKLRWVIVWDELNSGIGKVPVMDPICWCESQKKLFFVFCEFLLNEKSEVNFFRLKRSALKRGIQRCRTHCHIMFNKGAMAV
jgi:hypothetical protein